MNSCKIAFGALAVLLSAGPAEATTVVTTVQPTLAVKMKYASVDDCVKKITKLQEIAVKVDGIHPEDKLLGEVDDIQAHCQQLVAQGAPNPAQPAPPPPGSGAISCNLEKGVIYQIPQGVGYKDTDCYSAVWQGAHTKRFNVTSAAQCQQLCESSGIPGVCGYTHNPNNNGYGCSFMFDIGSCQSKIVKSNFGSGWETSGGYCNYKPD